MRCKQHTEKPITSQEVIEDLKFIAKPQSISQEELVDDLLQLGCSFTLKDIKKFPEEIALFEGTKRGNIACGASVIANMRDSEFGRDYSNDRFLSVDDNYPI